MNFAEHPNQLTRPVRVAITYESETQEKARKMIIQKVFDELPVP